MGRSAISTEGLTRDVAHRYLDAWTGGDLDTVRRLLVHDVSVESNVSGPGAPARFIDTLGQLANHLIKFNIVAETYDGNRAVLMYDCLVREPVGAIRMVEFLDLTAEGGIQRIRRVYDVVALRRLLPAFDA
jgi:ketosteroid isomerase-like protein